MAEALQHLSEDELSLLVDEFCYEQGCSLEVTWKAVRTVRDCAEEFVRKEQSDIVATFLAFTDAKADTTPLCSGNDTQFETCMNPPSSSYNDKVTKAVAIDELDCIVTSNSKGMACVVSCATGELVMEHVLSSTFNLVSAHYIATANCIVCSTEGSTLHVYDCGFPTYPQRKLFLTPTPVTSQSFYTPLSSHFCGTRDGWVFSVHDSAFKGSVVAERVHLRREVRRRWRTAHCDVTALVLIERKQGNGTLLIASAQCGTVTLLDLKRDCVLTTLTHEDGVTNIVWNPSYSVLVSLTNGSGPPLMWVLSPPASYRLSRDPSMKKYILVSLCSSPASPEVFTLDTEGAVSVWCLMSLTVTQVLSMNRETRGNPSALAYLHSKLLLCAFGKRVNLWRKEPVSEAEVHSHPTLGLASNDDVCITYTASEVKMWRPCHGLVYTLQPEGAVVSAALLHGDVLLGKADGSITLSKREEVLTWTRPRTEAVNFIFVSNAARCEVGVAYASHVVLLSYKELRLRGVVTVGEMRLQGHRLTCGAATQVVGCVLLGTHDGAVLLVDVQRRAVLSCIACGPHEVNGIAPLGTGLDAVASLSSSGRLHVWVVADAKADPHLRLLAQRKLSNATYAHQKASAIDAGKTRSHVSLRRPALLSGSFCTTLQVLYVADDAGWVMAVDVLPLLTHAAQTDFDPTQQLSGSCLSVVHQWQAHSDEVLTMSLCAGHVVTCALFDSSVFLWTLRGESVGSVASHGTVGDEVTRESVVAATTTVSRVGADVGAEAAVPNRARRFLLSAKKAPSAGTPPLPARHHRTRRPRPPPDASPPLTPFPLEAFRRRPVQQIPLAERSTRGCLWDIPPYVDEAEVQHVPVVHKARVSQPQPAVPQAGCRRRRAVLAKGVRCSYVAEDPIMCFSPRRRGVGAGRGGDGGGAGGDTRAWWEIMNDTCTTSVSTAAAAAQLSQQTTCLPRIPRSPKAPLSLLLRTTPPVMDGSFVVRCLRR